MADEIMLGVPIEAFEILSYLCKLEMCCGLHNVGEELAAKNYCHYCENVITHFA